MGFLREWDFSRDQPCETRLLARLESRMVSREKFAEVVGTWRVSGEGQVLYLTSYVRTEQVWSRTSRETGLARRDQSHGLVSRLISQGFAARRNSKLFVVASNTEEICRFMLFWMASVRCDFHHQSVWSVLATTTVWPSTQSVSVRSENRPVNTVYFLVHTSRILLGLVIFCWCILKLRCTSKHFNPIILFLVRLWFF